MLIIGTKNTIKRKTKGQDFKIALNQIKIKLSKSSLENKIVTPDTVPLVQSDIMIANKYNLTFFEIKYILKYKGYKSNSLFEHFFRVKYEAYNGAGERIRTADPFVGNEMLYH